MVREPFSVRFRLLMCEMLDGAAWQHSRALIRPAFTRGQIADVDFFESHVQELMRKIPKDGSTIDLAPLFISLTLGKYEKLSV